MPDEQNRDRDRDGESAEPFRRSGSGEDYEPEGNWAAERRHDQSAGPTLPGMEGAPSGAGDGGFGPEGGYSGAKGRPDADVIGEVNADGSALADEAHDLGRPRPGRASTGGSAADEPDAANERRGPNTDQ
jgi:hypothetical protein